MLYRAPVVLGLDLGIFAGAVTPRSGEPVEAVFVSRPSNAKTAATTASANKPPIIHWLLGANQRRMNFMSTRPSTTLALPIQAAARCISIFGNVDSDAAVAGRTGREWPGVRQAELAGVVGR